MSTKFLKALIPACLYAIAASSISASAEEYKSMIRYDRVWEHISINWDDIMVFYVRFNGPEEINGKTYHSLISFRKAAYDYEQDGNSSLFDVDENYYRHEGYMREEGGKIYTLVAIDDTETVFPRINLYTPEYKDMDSYKIEEKLLYDFTCKEGESYRALHLHHYGGKEMTYTVKSVDNIEIDGENYRSLNVYPETDTGYNDPILVPMVEGIGIIGDGCLTTFNILDHPTKPSVDYVFNRVLDMDGTVIYHAGSGFVDIPLTGFLGVDNIADQSEEKVAPIYDILGRRILAPTPGQLYIQNGRKHIAR